MLLVLILNGTLTFAQQFLSADSRALLGSGISLVSGNILGENPASSLKLTYRSIQLTQQIDFGLTNLQSFQMAIAVPMEHQSFGLAIHQSSFENLQIQRWCGNAAIALNKNISLGLNLNLIRSNYLNANANIQFIPEIGMIYQRKKNIDWAIHLINFGINSTQKQLPTALSLGLSSKINTQIILCAGLFLNKEDVFQIKAGIEYRLYNQLVLRAAIASKSPLLGIGVSWQQKRYQFWLSNTHHLFLGNSPSIKISYAF